MTLSSIYSSFSRSRIREVSWVIIGQFLSIVGGIASLKLLTKLLPPERYGELALGVALAGALAMLVFGPLNQIVFRFYSICSETGRLPGYFFVLRQLHFRAGAGMIFLAVTFAVFLDTLLDHRWTLLVVLSVFFSISSGLQGSVFSLLNALRSRKKAAFSQAADPWFRLICAMVLLYLFGFEGYVALFGFLIGSVAVLCLQLRFIYLECSSTLGERSHQVSKENILVLQQQFKKYGIPFIGFALVAMLSQYMDRWLLQLYASAEMVGIYAAMLQIATAPVSALVGIATQLIIPVVFSRAGALGAANKTSDGQQLIRTTVIIVVLLSSLFTAAAYVWGREIVTLVANQRYAGFADSFWIIVSGVALFNCAQILVASGLSLNRPSVYLLPKLTQALVLVPLGILLIPEWGVRGMSLALFWSSLAYFLWVLAVNMRLSKQLTV